MKEEGKGGQGTGGARFIVVAGTLDGPGDGHLSIGLLTVGRGQDADPAASEAGF